MLWYTKGIVYQQNYYKIGAESLNSTCFYKALCMYICIQVIELQELARRIVMLHAVLAKVVSCGFPKKEMFTQILLCLFSAHHYHLTKFQMLVYSG